MLKIIDDFDLKGLGEFGFERENGIIIKDNGVYAYHAIYIQEINKNINIFTRSITNEDIEKLYDLIQAGIVEKI